MEVPERVQDEYEENYTGTPQPAKLIGEYNEMPVDVYVKTEEDTNQPQSLNLEMFVKKEINQDSVLSTVACEPTERAVKIEDTKPEPCALTLSDIQKPEEFVIHVSTVVSHDSDGRSDSTYIKSEDTAVEQVKDTNDKDCSIYGKSVYSGLTKTCSSTATTNNQRIYEASSNGINDNALSIKNASNFQSEPQNILKRKCTRLYKCDHCHNCFTDKKTLKEHLRTHSREKLFKCSHCEKSYTQVGSLSRHKKICTGARLVSCSQCGKRFKFEYELNYHLRTHAAEKLNGQHTPLDLCPIKSVCHTSECKKDNNVRPIGDCGKRNLQVVTAIQSEAANDNPGSRDKSDKIKCFAETSVSGKQNILTNTSGIVIGAPSSTPGPTVEKLFKCEYCNNSFTTQSSLTRHLKTHNGDKSIQCVHCGKSCSQGSDLTVHMMMQHSDKETFKCEYCGEMFYQKLRLIDHIRTHTGDKPFKCVHCGQAFSQAGNLKSHMVIHTGEKPYKCENCGKSFSWKLSLHEHTKTHTSEKPYQCQFCGEHFSQRKKLKMHVYDHVGYKPFKCEHCDKHFVNKCSLTRHERIHSDERAFKCEICHKAFGYKHALTAHYRKHTGSKPVSCGQCGKDFIFEYELNYHMRTHVTGNR